MVSNFDLNRTALNNQMMGLSTDTKPTTGILPNSLFWELDTNGMYYFDGTQWQSIGGSGGGGGGDDLIELEYTVDNNAGAIKLSKTPAELNTLISEGKNFKFVCSAEAAEVTPMSEGDTYIAVGYDLNNNILTDLSLFREPFPTYEPEDEWRGIQFTNESGTMLVHFD